MGGYFIAKLAAWTLLFNCVIVASVDHQNLFQDLGLETFSDISKINISQDEYTRMMSVYLTTREQRSADPNSIPKLITTYKDDESQTNRLKFSIHKNMEDVKIESARLRILAPASRIESVQIEVHQILGDKHFHQRRRQRRQRRRRRRRLIDVATIHLSNTTTKWCEFDVTSAVKSWLSSEQNLVVELVCVNCVFNERLMRPINASINVLAYSSSKIKIQKRVRRSDKDESISVRRRRTDCRKVHRNGNVNGVKKRCCRHEMDVAFDELRFPEMHSIVEPKRYDAGYCQGQCPPNFNHATNHSRIQSIIHQIDRQNSKRLNRRAVPKACCSPSKLEPLEILKVNPNDPTKLILEKWDNMKVLECACS